jgi:hypothetical protein
MTGTGKYKWCDECQLWVSPVTRSAHVEPTVGRPKGWAPPWEACPNDDGNGAPHLLFDKPS